MPGLLALAACDDGTSGNTGGVNPNLPRSASREFRAIAGVSMGAYGAMNIGTKNDDLFAVICSLGGPVDMQQLLRYLIEDNLEVKPRATIPTMVGDDFTFDLLPPYPDRGTRIDMARDLFLAFGNPFLHHPNPTQLYLAQASEPAMILQDDRFGSFMAPVPMRSFSDGGDGNENGVRELGEPAVKPTDVLLAARGTAGSIAGGGVSGTVVGNRELIDTNADNVFDVGDGIVINYSEPFDDIDGDFVFEPMQGETFDDFGLDGVDGTNDFGEGNASFDYDPDRANWLAEDPFTRLQGFSNARIADLCLYMDVGSEDLLGFAAHYDNLVAMLNGRGLTVTESGMFAGGCVSIPDFADDRVLVTYDGGHIGIPMVDDIDDQLLNGDFCSASLLVWQRLRSMLGFLDSAFANGDYGLGGARPFGDVVSQQLPAPVLTPSNASTPATRPVVVYRPPAFFNTDREFPIVYFLGGYGQTPNDYERVGLLMDALIVADEVQNMYLAFLPGDGGFEGSFYVDHVVPHAHAPMLQPTTAQYERSILENMIPQIEDSILSGRIKR